MGRRSAEPVGARGRADTATGQQQEPTTVTRGTGSGLGRWPANRRVGTRLLVATALVAVAALVVGLVSLSVVQDLQTQRQREVGRAVR